MEGSRRLPLGAGQQEVRSASCKEVMGGVWLMMVLLKAGDGRMEQVWAQGKLQAMVSEHDDEISIQSHPQWGASQGNASTQTRPSSWV